MTKIHSIDWGWGLVKVKEISTEMDEFWFDELVNLIELSRPSSVMITNTVDDTHSFTIYDLDYNDITRDGLCFRIDYVDGRAVAVHRSKYILRKSGNRE